MEESNTETSPQESEEILEYNVEETERTETIETSEAIEDSEKVVRTTRLPLNKIKTIMKMDPDVSLTSNEAVFAVTKVTELFIESIVKEAYSYTVKGKRKTMTKKDFDNVIETLDCLCFLEGAMDF